MVINYSKGQWLAILRAFCVRDDFSKIVEIEPEKIPCSCFDPEKVPACIKNFIYEMTMDKIDNEENFIAKVYKLTKEQSRNLMLYTLDDSEEGCWYAIVGNFKIEDLLKFKNEQDNCTRDNLLRIKKMFEPKHQPYTEFQYFEDFIYVHDSLSKEERLAQLAEECTELAQIALKYRRCLGSSNPTPIVKELAEENLIEEIKDVLLCVMMSGDYLETCGVLPKRPLYVNAEKLKRWAERIRAQERRHLDEREQDGTRREV